VVARYYCPLARHRRTRHVPLYTRREEILHASYLPARLHQQLDTMQLSMSLRQSVSNTVIGWNGYTSAGTLPPPNPVTLQPRSKQRFAGQNWLMRPCMPPCMICTRHQVSQRPSNCGWLTSSCWSIYGPSHPCPHAFHGPQPTTTNHNQQHLLMHTACYLAQQNAPKPRPEACCLPLSTRLRRLATIPAGLLTTRFSQPSRVSSSQKPHAWP